MAFHVVQNVLQIPHISFDFQKPPPLFAILSESYPPVVEFPVVVDYPSPSLAGEKQLQGQGIVFNTGDVDQGERGGVLVPFIVFHEPAPVRETGASAGGIGETPEIPLIFFTGKAGPFPFALDAFRHPFKRREVGGFMSLSEAGVDVLAQCEIPSFWVLPPPPPVW